MSCREAGKATKRCGRCGKTGHNRKTCTAEIGEQQRRGAKAPQAPRIGTNVAVGGWLGNGGIAAGATQPGAVPTPTAEKDGDTGAPSHTARKGKKRKLPSAPKHPLNAYNYFYIETKRALDEERVAKSTTTNRGAEADGREAGDASAGSEPPSRLGFEEHQELTKVVGARALI